MSELIERGWIGRRPWLPSEIARVAPGLVALAALVFLAIASAHMLHREPPFINWYYLSAWYPTLLLLDCAVAVRSGRYFLISRPGFTISLFGWSAVLWFFFELMNFRLLNWYYVFLPPDRWIRWAGTTLSFMTVLPAIFLAERWLAGRRKFEYVRSPEFEVSPRMLRNIFVTGIAFTILTLAWPRMFFPLVWGALTLLLEPWNYRRDPRRSLLGDLAAGRPARLLRLLAGGLVIGFIWELYNIEARSKWIYTVPGFENFKLFEMPLLGFFGFPIFALDCFVIYQSLVLGGVAVPAEPGRGTPVRMRVGRTVTAAAAAIAFSFLVLLGIDRWTTDSLRPRVTGLWVADATAQTQLTGTPYADLFALASASPAEVARAVGVSDHRAETWIAAARLATLRGIGTENARLLWDAGVRSVAALAAADPASLSELLRAGSERSLAATPAKVRVWVRAAQRAPPDISLSSGL